MKTIKVRSSKRSEMVDITAKVEAAIESKTEGVCVVFTQHTTCGLTINENADPDVQSDMLGFLERLIPQYEEHFRHFEHNADSHIKSSLMGASVTVPFENGDGTLASCRRRNVEEKKTPARCQRSERRNYDRSKTIHQF